MNVPAHYTAFAGGRLLHRGRLEEVAIEAHRATRGGASVLIFDDRTGRSIDVDLRGEEDDISARLRGLEEPTIQETARKAGRPRLGVVAREVTLLPRHWDWLSRQEGGASARLRRLVDLARKQGGDSHVAREAAQAADCFMMAMLGNQPNYEEAARALYAGQGERFRALSEPWPTDLRDHARRLAEPALGDNGETIDPQSVRDVLLAQFEIGWALLTHHLETLSTEECLWRPAPRCLHVSRQDGGEWRADWPDHERYDIGPPSIGWTTWHICYWWTKALEHLEGKTTLSREDVHWPGGAEELRIVVAGLRDRWLELLRTSSGTDLLTPRPMSWPLPDSALASTAAWLNVELTKNAAEIGMVRFLYAVRAVDPSAAADA